MSKKLNDGEIIVGGVYKSLLYGEFKVLREIIAIKFGTADKQYKPTIYEVEFLDTGYHTTVSKTCIKAGSVKDRLVPAVDSVGYMGQNNIWIPYSCKMDSYDHSLYKIWNHMLDRCYKPSTHRYHRYGGIGVTVTPEWHCFYTFEKDAKELPGYQNRLQNPRKFQLDKDYLQQHIPHSQRVYSKYTCRWISQYENLMLVGKENGRYPYFGVTGKGNEPYYYIKMQIEGYNNDEIYFGKFSNILEAANFFNYIYPMVIPPELNTINLHNDVPDLGFTELMRRNKLVRRDNLNLFLIRHNLPLEY